MEKIMELSLFLLLALGLLVLAFFILI